MAQIAQLRLLPVAFLLEPCVGVGGRSMRLVAALFIVEVAAIVIRAILGPEAFLRGPGLNQRSVHGEVLIAHVFLRRPVDLGKTPPRHVGVQQTVAVLGENRVVPHCIVHAQVNEPAEQQVVVDLLDQQALGANGEEDLSSVRRMYSGVIDGRPEPAYSASTSTSQHSVGKLANRTQRVVFRHPLLQRNIAEHPILNPLITTHTLWTAQYLHGARRMGHFNKFLALISNFTQVPPIHRC